MKYLILFLCLAGGFISVNAQQQRPVNDRETLIQKMQRRGSSLQQGKVVGYKVYFVSQPKGELPDVQATEATLNLRLQIEPNALSEIEFININFVKDTVIYPRNVYINKRAYATMPISHYAPLAEMIKLKLAAGNSGDPMTIQFSEDPLTGDILLIE